MYMVGTLIEDGTHCWYIYEISIYLQICIFRERLFFLPENFPIYSSKLLGNTTSLVLMSLFQVICTFQIDEASLSVSQRYHFPISFCGGRARHIIRASSIHFGSISTYHFLEESSIKLRNTNKSCRSQKINKTHKPQEAPEIY